MASHHFSAKAGFPVPRGTGKPALTLQIQAGCYHRAKVAVKAWTLSGGEWHNCAERTTNVQRAILQRDEVIRRTRESGLIAILRHTEARRAIETAEALQSAGVEVVEVTMNTA